MARAPRLAAATTVRRLKLGAAEITIISDGVFTLPRSMVLPGRADPEIEALFKAHGAPSEVVAETNVAVVRLGASVLLIDPGAGPDFMPTLGRLGDRLEQAGLREDEVTHVVFTHAHPDHFWGVLDPFGDGSRWPNARHVMAKPEHDFWMDAEVENRVPPFQKAMAGSIQKRLKALGDTITTSQPNAEIAPGIALVATPGHTPGHVSVAVRSGDEEVVVVGDALTHAAMSFGAPDWRWGPDIDPDLAIATRRRLLDDLATRKTGLIGYHLPWPGLGRVERQGNAYRFVAA